MRRTAHVLMLLVIAVLLPSSARGQGTETVIYFHTDAIGSVRMTTDVNGQVLQRYDYLPFGEPWPAQPQPERRRFADGEFDLESELNHFGVREYDSRTGRFTRADDPGYGNPFDPQSMNMYAYAYNNPLTFVDPSGHQAVIVMPDGNTGVSIIPNNSGATTICGPDSSAGECDPGYLKFLFDAFARPWDNIGRPLILPETPGELAASLAVTVVASVFTGGSGLPAAGARATALLTKIAPATLRGSRYASIAAGITAKEFQRNLMANGYKVIAVTAGKNGSVTVLSNGTKTYNIYNATSGGLAAQVMNAAGDTLSKIRLIGP